MKTKILTIYLFVFQLISLGQSENLTFLKNSSTGVQSCLLFGNDGSHFSMNPNILATEQEENATLYPKLTVSGDFDGDGLLETAMFFEYLYYPNLNATFNCTKVVIYKPLGQEMTPIGTWFSTLKSQLDVSKVMFTNSGDYNNDGKADIAILLNNPDSTNQYIYVLESDGKGFSNLKTYYKGERKVFNFDRVKFLASGDFNHDGKTDLATFYNYAGSDNATKQTIFIFKSNGNTFSPFKALYATTKATLNFLNLKFVTAADFNGDGNTDLACIGNIGASPNQRIVVLENNAADTLFSKEYANVDNADLNFNNIRFAIAGKFTTDNVADIAFCYDNPTNATQSIYVLQSTKNSFLPAVEYYSGTKQQLAFADITSLVSSTMNNSQKISATLWKNNKRGAVTFGFDDGYVNAFRYGANYLAQQKLRGTFYDISNLGFNNEVDYANWDTLSYYNKQGHEICSHTANHKGIGTYTGADSILLVDNLLQKSKSDLDNRLQQNTISLSYPFGNFNYQSLTEVGKYFLNARSSQNGFNLATPFDFMALRSKFVSSTTLPLEIDSWLSRAETYQYHLSIMFHNMSNVPFDKSADEYIYGFDDFKQSVIYAQQRSLWIDTQGKVYKYIRERNEMKIVKYETVGDTLLIKVTCGLDTALFNEELTLKIELPTTWNTDSTTIADSGKCRKLPVLVENSKLYTYVNSIPDNRELKLWQSKYVANSINPGVAGSTYVLSTFRNANKTFLNIKGELKQGMHVDAYNMLGLKILSTDNIINAMPVNNSISGKNNLLTFILSDKDGNRLATCKAIITN